ncbi:hypothetical protein [Sphingomonas sp. dw_22]|uniref:hypothetical protein n=1 Tax=Sphingomonas sp. dw_22 TaxID=2721175 RepID=UPI001BD33909|nr:hypothetical protein [Sphingomonas sp. dw_22]
MIERRDILKLGAAVAATGTLGTAAIGAAPGKVWILSDPADPVASATPVARAVDRLRKALTEKGVASAVSATADPAPGELVLLLANRASGHAEGFAIAPDRFKGARALRASSSGRLGLAYAVLELADRVRLSSSPDLGLDIAAMDEKPANAIRSMARSFCSEIEDKGWYYDKGFWADYLDMLVANRFNRVALFFGFGYDFPKNITDDYFQFPYVFLFDVPGYDVRLNPPLPAGEREKNLETLRFISSEAAARGLHFQLGIWTHAYDWVESPKAFHRIEGLTAKTHAAYCRDAMARLLKECPDINGLTFRIHVESGIADGSFSFWRTLFEGFAAAGRPVEIDMHAKGITEEMIAIAQATGMPMQVSPKFAGEHMGLGYHQADIRENEVPTPERIAKTGNSSSGVRRFTRYGYADLFVEGRKYGVLHRLWPGTQRFLLWGDPATAAAYSRAAGFCDSAGLEICEPLTFKGREASGHPGGRNAYQDKALEPGLNDWAKFEYEYRLWGRLLYDPDADRAGWGRYLARTFGPAATAAETALAHASRTLPLFTTANIPSTSNRYYWPEIYDNMPVMPLTGYKPIADLPDGYTLADISALDPQLFSSIAEHADLVVAGKADPKYSPAEVARALEGFAGMAATALKQARAQATAPSDPAFRRLEEDVLIQIGLARFFAAKLQSGLLFQVYRKTGAIETGRQALAIYARGRDIWVAMAERARGVYVPDISFGTEAIVQRGHWIDRVPDIDRDIAAMRAALSNPMRQDGSTRAPIARNVLDPSRPRYAFEHAAPDSFTPGQPLAVRLSVPSDMQHCALYFRHVNHGERWRSVPMAGAGGQYSAEIPGDYTASPFPLQYYFLLQGARGDMLAPGLDANWAGQPYYAVWRRRLA